MASDKRRTQIDFKTLGTLAPRSRAGYLEPIPEEADFTDHKASNINALSASISKRNPWENGNTVDSSSGLKHFRLVDAVQSGIRAHEHIRTRHASPWVNAEKIYELRHGVDDWVTIAERRDISAEAIRERNKRNDPLSHLVAVKKMSGHDVKDKLHKIQQIRNPNIACPLEIFNFEDASYIVYEFMVSISHLAGNPYLNEIRLAAILGQIINGLVYLVGHGLQHDSLSCSRVLIDLNGEVKISGQEDCRTRSSQESDSRDIRAVSHITMELMQGYVKEDGAVGLDDLRRWPSDSHAVGFLSETTSATSVAELMKHPLLRLPWQKDMLTGLVMFALIRARIEYRYPPT